MTATDELRAELTKRGESWHKWPDEDSTTWQAYSNPHTATESMDGTLIVTGLTPEQAIVATLGSGTCHNVHEPPKDTTFWPSPHFKCSECGSTHVSMEYVFYCPNCGRKVVNE